MKQLLQNLNSGATYIEEVPAPSVSGGKVLIQTAYSLVSQGTERMLVDFGRANLIQKARQQPERVKQVFDKIKTDGLQPTIRSVLSKLGDPLPLGNSNCGVVIGVGDGVPDLQIGDRVVSNGPHAEIVSIARHLVAPVPSVVTFEESAFTVIGAIALQGLRLCNPTLGETVVVIGLGLIGQLVSQLARANGCRVIGCDIDESKASLARGFGIESFTVTPDINPARVVADLTRGQGADGVIITASGKSEAIVNQSAAMCRTRGRVVLVGVVPLKLNRALFYTKEISFQVSCSYGPGRYDRSYEEQGNDYPAGFVRWTEQRNFTAVLDAMAHGRLKVKALISETVPFEEAASSYSRILKSKNSATLLAFKNVADIRRVIAVPSARVALVKGEPGACLAIIGTGNFTAATMMPLLKKINAPVKYLCSEKGATATSLAKKFGVPYSATDYSAILADSTVTGVIIATRHNLHAKQCCEALRSGKHVFVEKPLALTAQDLVLVSTSLAQSSGTLMVGFNRRFSPLISKAKALLGDAAVPLNAVFTMNAGSIPRDHWTQDPVVGGGRIIGEACHFIDLFAYVCSSPIVSVCASCLGSTADQLSDNVTIIMKSANGSQGTIHYFSNGSKSYSKEKVEIFSANRVLVIDNFIRMQGFGFSSFKQMKLSNQDKGHAHQFAAFVNMVKNGGTPPIGFSSIVNTSASALAAIQSIKQNQWIAVDAND